jgi:glycosyltransferase involved in cell wall biosynthesis
MKRVTIVTACFNAEKYIGETIRSVINQNIFSSNCVELEYFIIDGKSTDKTLNIIEQSIQGFKNGKIEVLSEKDMGLYDALSKGLKHATGDICSYINAGDIYSNQAIDIVLNVFQSKKIEWLTGLNIIYNEQSQIVGAVLPFRYRRKFFLQGEYGGILPLVQQESTFWSTTLNNQIDYDIFSRMKYAGDYYLWTQFSKVTDLNIVEAYLGGFKHHKGQLSENMAEYFKEASSVIDKPLVSNFALVFFDKVIWYSPSRIKKILNQKHLFRFDHQIQEWV